MQRKNHDITSSVSSNLSSFVISGGFGQIPKSKKNKIKLMEKYLELVYSNLENE